MTHHQVNYYFNLQPMFDGKLVQTVLYPPKVGFNMNSVGFLIVQKEDDNVPVNYFSIYLQAFFVSDIMNLEGHTIEEWAGRGHRQVGHHSTWEWPIQQRPITWKARKMAPEQLAPDGNIGEALGDWRPQHHQIMEWYLDANTCTLYDHVEGVWTTRDATHISRLRFQVDTHSCDVPNQYSPVVEAC
jgi:hypothetical protein